MLDLREYQHTAVRQCREAFVRGARRVCLVMPTGGGKTRTCAAMAAGAVQRGRPVLWLAHRKELVEQAFGTLRGFGLAVGTISASATTRVDAAAPVQVATVQTILARGLTLSAGLIIADESHRFVAAEFAALLKRVADAPVVGPTATPERGDGVGLSTMFDELVLGPTVGRLVELGHLVPAEVIRPKRRLRSHEISDRPVDAYLRDAAGLKAISFTSSVEAAEQHAAEFRAAGINAEAISGGMSTAKRDDILARFRAGEVRVLCNVHVLTEGFDVPDTEVCILAGRCGTTGVFLQRVGRVLRGAPGKKRALILDLQGVSHVHGHPTRDLYTFSLDGRGIRKAGAVASIDYCAVCGAPTDGAEACEECGSERGGVQPPKVVRTPMERFSGFRSQTVEQKVVVLSRWLQEGAAKGHKPAATYHKFSYVYGEWPTPALIAAARRAS